jgi:hypothetical protein
VVLVLVLVLLMLELQSQIDAGLLVCEPRANILWT